MIQLQSLKLKKGSLLIGQMTKFQHHSNFQRHELDFHYQFVSNTNGRNYISLNMFIYLTTSVADLG